MTIKIDFTLNGKVSVLQIKLSILNNFIHKKINLFQEKSTDIEEIQNERLNIILKILNRNIKQLHIRVKNILNQIQIHSFNWNTSLSTGEADLTGITSGILIGLKWMIIGILNMYFRFSEDIQINVVPIYRGKGIYSDLKIEFSFRIIKLIISMIPLYLLWRKVQSELISNKLQFE